MRKLIGILLTLVLLMTCMVLPTTTASAETATESEQGGETSAVWDPTKVVTSTDELAGSGTEADPWLITNGSELLYTVQNQHLGKYFRLANDIVLNDITVSADGTYTKADENAVLNQWYGVARHTAGFCGFLDGDGHIVRGLYIDDADTTDFFGLIPSVNGGGDSLIGIYNLGIEDAYINAPKSEASAGIAGFFQNAKLEMDKCYVGSSVYINAVDAGGLLGWGDATKMQKISNCYVTANLNGSSKEGAVTGNAWNFKTASSYENCWTTASALDGNSKQGNKSNCTTGVTATTGYIGDCFDGNTFFPGYAFAAVEGGLPTLKVFKGMTEDIWGGLADSALEGSGTENVPYLITTGEELAYVAANNGKIESADEYFKLANDIYLNNVFAENWKANADNNVWYSAATKDEHTKKAFSGNLDGNGYCIYGIWYPTDSAAYAAGLVPGIGAVTVKNLGIKEAQIVAANYAGGIVGYWSGSASVVSGCFADSTVDISQNSSTTNGGAGGIIGYTMGGNASTYLTVENCYSVAVCESARDQTQRANGIIGTSWNAYYKVNNSYSLGAPCFADTYNRASLLAYDHTFVKFTDEAGNTIDAVPTDNSNYKKVYTDYTATYKYDTANKMYGTPSYTLTQISYLDKAYQNVYGDASKTANTGISGAMAYTVLTTDNMLGVNAFEAIKGFDGDVWYAVNEVNTAPMLRVHGTAIGDVNEDGVGLATGDDEALRRHLIGRAQALNGNYNKDDATDILDLVALTLAKKK